MTALETRAVDALKKYYSKLSPLKNPFADFAQLQNYYTTDQHLLKNYNDTVKTDFLQAWGQAITTLNNPGKLETAILKLAAGTSKTVIPTTQSFFKALSSEALSFTTADLKSAVKEGLTDAAKATAVVVVVGVTAYLGWIFVGAAFFMMLRGQKK